jgi:hypothetical protein
MEAAMETWPDPEDEHEEEPEPKHEEEEEPLRCMSTSRTGVKQFENSTHHDRGSVSRRL